MNRIDQLISDLCPNGVKPIALSEIATIVRGGNLQKKDFIESGVPCIHYGQIYTKYGLSTDKAFAFISDDTARKQKMAKKNDIIMAVTSENIEDVCKCVVWLGNEPVAVSGHTAIISHNQDAKYLAYYFHSSMFFEQKKKLAHGTKVIEVTPDRLNDVMILLPPIDIQHEIVQILDNYSDASDKLISELKVELENRKQQYDYITNEQFPSIKDSDCEWVELGDVATVTKLAGYEFTKYVTYSETGEIIALRGLNVKNGRLVLDDVKYVDNSELSMLSRSKLRIGDMLFTYVGTVGQVALIDENDRFYLAPNVALIRIDDKKYIPKYMMYYFLTSKFRDEQISRLQQTSSMNNIPMEKIRKFKMPRISMPEQVKVVSFLEQFDELFNDICSSITTEIEARGKQYEFYRDMLLTSKEAM